MVSSREGGGRRGGCWRQTSSSAGRGGFQSRAQFRPVRTQVHFETSSLASWDGRRIRRTIVRCIMIGRRRRGVKQNSTMDHHELGTSLPQIVYLR